MGDDAHLTPGGDVDLAWRDGWPVGDPELCQRVLLDDPYAQVSAEELEVLQVVRQADIADLEEQPRRNALKRTKTP